MSTRIVTTGRGGSGKTTFVALLTKYLNRPLLLLDIDPDESLNDMLGITLEDYGVKTISEVLFDIQNNQGYEVLKEMPLPQKIEYLINSHCIYESKRFDLVSLGVKWTEGCYCAPNNLLRVIIPKLAENYRYVLIDAPAGLEHLNRKVSSEIDDLFIILDPSLKSIKNIRKIQKLTQELGVKYSNFYLVANYRFPDDQVSEILSRSGTYLGKIAYDAQVETFNLEGRSLLELPEDSPASLSMKIILEKANYAKAQKSG